MPSNEKALSL